MSRKPTSNKTKSLMNLLERGGEAPQNPIIDETFKHDHIHIIEEQQVKTKKEKEKGINVVSELVGEILPEAVRRFNCCNCDVCMAELTVKALNAIPSHYVAIKTNKDLEKVSVIKDNYNRSAIRAIVRIVILERNNVKHEKIK